MNNEYQSDGFSIDYIQAIISGKEFTSNDTNVLIDYFKEIENQMFEANYELFQNEKSKKVMKYLNTTKDGQNLKT